MRRFRGRSRLVWMALLCSLLLPVTAVKGMNVEMRAYQLEALGCGMPDRCDMPDCHGDCCRRTTSQMTGCNCGGASLPYLSPCGTINHDCQGSPHRPEQNTPVFKTFTADIFHPPRLALSSV